ncbi:MAG: Gfo/Idh/MocA family oxidoreductase [Phycisphaeraceae bacterium]
MKIGIIGCGGRIRGVVRQVLQHAPEVEVAGVYDPAEASVAAAREAFGSEIAVHDSEQSLVDDASISWVFIGSVNHVHARQAVAALDAGKDVFCEKPLATTLDGCVAMRDAVHRSGRRFFVGFTLRYAPLYRRIRQLIDEGGVGEPISLEFNETLEFSHGSFIQQDWRRHSEASGSFLLEKCCHDVDIVNWLLGSRAARVASFGGLNFFKPGNEHHVERVGPNHEGQKAYHVWGHRRFGSPFIDDKDIIDNQVAILEYANEVRATFHTNCHSAFPERRLYIVGSEGAIRADLIPGVIEHRRIGWEQSKTVYHTHGGGHGGGDAVMTREIAACMRGGMAPPTTVEDGLASAVTCLAIDEAMGTGRVVELAPTWTRCDAPGEAVAP